MAVPVLAVQPQLATISRGCLSAEVLRGAQSPPSITRRPFRCLPGETLLPSSSASSRWISATAWSISTAQARRTSRRSSGRSLTAPLAVGSPVVDVELVADAAHRVVRGERDVVGDPPDDADQRQQFDPGVRVLGRAMLPDTAGSSREPSSKSRPAWERRAGTAYKIGHTAYNRPLPFRSHLPFQVSMPLWRLLLLISGFGGSSP